VPSKADAIAVFHEKQKLLYAFLESKVLTDCGKVIIHDHEHDYNAQKGLLQNQKLPSTVHPNKDGIFLGDGTWNGTTESFIINWQIRSDFMRNMSLQMTISQMTRNGS
jgi:hypothetical protein